MILNASFYLHDDSLRSMIRQNLRGFDTVNDDDQGKKKAAVAVVIVNSGVGASVYGVKANDPCEAALVLTRRSGKLKKHAGQWALPGGSVDHGETPEQTALRELEEEVGLALPCDSVLGRLDDFTTRSGFTITPVVIWGERKPVFTQNHDEVESIHRIPLSEFMREDAPMLQSIPESDNPVLLMPVGRGWIASPTGAIIYQFCEVALRGTASRVAHYEQPYFAWK